MSRRLNINDNGHKSLLSITVVMVFSFSNPFNIGSQHFWVSIVSIQCPPLCHHIIFCVVWIFTVYPSHSHIFVLILKYVWKVRVLETEEKNPALSSSQLSVTAIWDPFLWLDHSCHCFELESQRSLAITIAVVLNEAFHSFTPPVLHCFCTMSLFMFFLLL